MRFEAASRTDAGPRRINEDEAAWWHASTGALIGAVADGLGGMGGGGDASRIAIQTLRAMLDAPNIDAARLVSAAQAAHQAILHEQIRSPELRRMATTLTAGAFTELGLVGVHCGDSRVSIARDSGIIRLTSDHSEGERLFRAGKLTKDEYREYPRKNILDSALGVHGEPRIDTFAFSLLPGDKLFFTTDGIHNRLMLREMREISENHERPGCFVEEVCAAVAERGADDNFSIVAVFVYA